MDHVRLGRLHVIADDTITCQYELDVDTQRRDLRQILGIRHARTQFVSALSRERDASKLAEIRLVVTEALPLLTKPRGEFIIHAESR